MRTWLVIPAVAIAAAGVFATEGAPHAIAVGAFAAALAAAVRAFAGGSAAAALAAGAAGLFGALGLADSEHVRAIAGAAAAAFAVAELSRPVGPGGSPLPAIGGALAAAVLAPAGVALVPVVGVRWLRGPWSRPRWALALPVVGVAAVTIALAAALARTGPLARLWAAWSGTAAPAQPALDTIARIGAAAGPIAAVAALAGLALAVLRGRWSAAAMIAATAGAAGVALRVGAPAAGVVAIAALTTGIALARLAALVRWPPGQAFVGATAAFIVLAAPVWTLASR